MRARHLLALAIFLCAPWCLAQRSLAGIRVEPENIFLTEGSQKPLTAAFNGSPARTIWMSDNPSVAAVDAAGMVTASASVSGSATITAVSGIFRDSTTVTVVLPPVATALSLSSPLTTIGQPVLLTPIFSNGMGIINGTGGSSVNVISGAAVQVVALANTVYTLVVTNPAGDTASAPAPPITAILPPVISSFYPTLAFVTTGNGTQLIGTFSGGVGQILLDGGTFGPVLSSPFAIPASPQSVANTYVLNVQNQAGTISTASVTVQALPPPVITSFTVFPTVLGFGGGIVTFSANFCCPGFGIIEPGKLLIKSGSTASINITTTTQFTLTVTNQASATATAQVTVPVL